MRAEEFEQLVAEDVALRVGDQVKAYWPQTGITRCDPARVTKINRQSVRVELIDEGTSPGRQLILPRIGDIRNWTANNCVRATEETAVPSMVKE